MTGSDMDGDSISAKTLTASTDGSSDKGDTRSSVHEDSFQSSIFIRVFVGEFNVQKCLQFPPSTPVWEVKQKLFSTLPKELKDSFNYGLFCPPYNGRAGKFLDDERLLADYPMPGHVGYLELKYKRRVYKMLNLDEKTLKQLMSKANLRKFTEYVLNSQTEKITKLCAKGLDPNFHDLDNGETPLTLATALKEPVPVMVALINGGAHLDFRALDGCTPLHRATQHNNFKAAKGLLELGSSPNYKDAKELTPLYYSVTHASDPNICEALLHDYAQIGTVDPQGWQEVHQACRHGYVRHLEHLIFYGADIDARNASGNTPLHVCAVNNQESCARVLLFRGADKYAKNFANQTAFHVAVIAGATELSEVIKRHSTKDIVPLREKPKYNPRRRRRSCSPSSSISRTDSVSRLTSRSPSLSNGNTTVLASPSPSSRSFMMYSTTGSVSSGGSNGEHSHPSEDCSTSGVVTDKSSCSDESTSTPATVRMLPPNILRSSRPQERNNSLTNRSDRMSSYCPASTTYGTGRNDTLRSVHTMRRSDSAVFTDSTPHSRDSSRERERAGIPKTVTLARGPLGYGFVLRGSKSGNMTVNREIQVVPGDVPPALQYLDDVDKNGPAELAGLRSGDFLLSINGEDVRMYPHERAVNLIRHSQYTVTLTVLSPPLVPIHRSSTYGSSSSLSKYGAKIPHPPRRDPRTSLTIGPERSRSYLGLNELTSSDSQSSSDTAKIASIRTRPISRRITAVEIGQLMERGGSTTPAPTLSSFAPLPKVEPPSPAPSSGTSTRVFSSVAHMKRQRAVMQQQQQQQQQQQRRRTDVGATVPLHKDYHSTPDLSAEGDDQPLTDEENDEGLYSDTVYRPQPPEVYHQNGRMSTAYNPVREVTKPVQPQQTPYQLQTIHQNHQNTLRNVPAVVPQHHNSTGAYARPILHSQNSHEKPPVPSNKPYATAASSAAHHDNHHRLGTIQRSSMKPSFSLDERTYSQINTVAHVHEPPEYAAPEDPEPDYFSDEDRHSYASSGRGTSVISSSPSTPAVPKSPASISKPPVGRMLSQPPPPPPPPVSTNAAPSSFAAQIAKAAQARQGKPTATNGPMAHAASAPALKLIPLNDTSHHRNIVVVSSVPPPAKQNDFQSELAKAIQRRSQEKEQVAAADNRRSSSTDVDALPSSKALDAPAGSVKDRITFLEKKGFVPAGGKSVRISGITTDQSSTDLDDIGNRGPATRAGVTKSVSYHSTTGGLIAQEVEDAQPNRFSGYRSATTNGFLRDHDSASINSQSSASTLSSGYESPTLKYGMGGEQLWSQTAQPDTSRCVKFAQGHEQVGSHLAPPPEFC